MKAEWCFEIGKFHINKFCKPIRSKIDLLRFLMEAVKIIISTSKCNLNISENYIVLKIDKMSRLFFVLGNKIFSISFPFALKENEDSYDIVSKSSCFQHSIDNTITSNVIAFLNTIEETNISCSIDFASLIEESGSSIDIFPLIKELLLLEDGYIRYDYDELNYKKAVDKGCPHLHPLNHLDIFYTNTQTFKLGLDDRLDHGKLLNTLSIDTDCLYLYEK